LKNYRSLYNLISSFWPPIPGPSGPVSCHIIRYALEWPHRNEFKTSIFFLLHAWQRLTNTFTRKSLGSAANEFAWVRKSIARAAISVRSPQPGHTCNLQDGVQLYELVKQSVHSFDGRQTRIILHSPPDRETFVAGSFLQNKSGIKPVCF